MDPFHQEILRDLENSIVIDIDIRNNIIEPLKSKNILKEDHLVIIEAAGTRGEKAKALLKALPECGPQAFSTFHQALRRHYSWISDNIDKCLKSRKNLEVDTGPITRYSDFPRKPLLPITRHEKTKQLRNELEKLKPNGYLALHGMKGYGKSCLAAHTLENNDLAKSLFGGEIYWIKFIFKRDRNIEDEILIQLNSLLHRVLKSEKLIEPLTTPDYKETIIRNLKFYFSKPEHKNALLVLDDVFDKEIIEAFDFSCKTLVITTDISVLEDKHPSTMEMNSGFSETETLLFFAQAIGTQPDRLNIAAKQIHKECDGMPLLISMFAAQFKQYAEQMKVESGDGRWQYYLRCLREKDRSSKVMGQFIAKQEAIFEMCINLLTPEKLDLYESLAIFSEDVNINSKTLQMLWDQSEYNADEIMLEFFQKSLVARQWNIDLKAYVYGIHELLLLHLHDRISPEKLQEMHKNFIEKFLNRVGNDFSNVPNDNYTLFYIGHHLEQAKMYDQFPKLYLNLDFLQSKINQTGLSDLLIDLKHYREYIIANDSENREQLEDNLMDIEKFLKEETWPLADHRHKECLDLVQIAMCHATAGYVTQTARELAEKRTSLLYFSHEKKHDQHDLPLTEEVKVEVTATAITHDPDKILIGSVDGRILLWNLRNQHQIEFSGFQRTDRIRKILISQNIGVFLALSAKGILKLFELYSDFYDSDEENTEPLQSPKQKQPNYKHIFESNYEKDDSVLTLLLEDEVILDMTFHFHDKIIAACTDKGTFAIWNLKGECLFKCPKAGSRLKCITFSTPSNLLHMLDEDKGVVITYTQVKDMTYEYASQYNLQLESNEKNVVFVYFRAVPNVENTLMVVTKKNALCVLWNQDAKSSCGIHSYKKQFRSHIPNNDNNEYRCATITHDGSFLILGDSRGFINVYSVMPVYALRWAPELQATYKGRVTCLDTIYLDKEMYYMILGGGRRLINCYKLEQHKHQIPKLVRKPLFDAIVNSYDEEDIVTKETMEDTITVAHGNVSIAKTESIEGEIISLTISPDGNRIVYTMEKGSVILFDVRTQQSTTILKLSQCTSFVKFLHVDGEDLIVVRENNDGLMVWKNKDITFFVGNVGPIVFIDILKNGIILTHNSVGEWKFWRATEPMWTCLRVVTYDLEPTAILQTYLNTSKKYLTVLKDNRELVLLGIEEKEDFPPTNVQLMYKTEKLYDSKLMCSKISQDDKYLAVGLENGDIAILELLRYEEILKLEFHRHPIRELHFAPSFLQVPILLSVDDDELVWWNISLVDLEKEKLRKFYRTGISRSISTSSLGKKSPSQSPRSSFRMSNSQSIGALSHRLSLPSECNVLNNNDSGNGANGNTSKDNCSLFWKSKKAKYPKKPTLLSVIQLPASCTAKVCVSSDFTKFVTVDIHGCISTFKLFGYS